MALLKSQFTLSPEKIYQDLLIHSKNYNSLHNPKKILKTEFAEKFELFSNLFGKSAWSDIDFEYLINSGIITAEAFKKDKFRPKEQKGAAQTLFFPGLLEAIQNHLEPIVQEARNTTTILSRVVADCSKFVRNFQDQEELLGHNDLLIKMRKAINNPSFATRLRNLYSAVIVDEFQDTDPTQWEIFSHLYANNAAPWNGYLILVGDPKQSIYAFRQADIYTYLSAVNTLGADAHSTLDTNYRSVPKLVDAINVLFKSCKSIFALPRLSKDLPYKEVNAGIPGSHDTSPHLHFWQIHYDGKISGAFKKIESDFLFPAIANEIIRLHESNAVALNRNAVLVSDRYQSARLITYLNSRNIPVRAQRGKNIASSTAVDAMRELITGILNYHQRSSLGILLGNRIIGITHTGLEALNDEEILLQCDNLRKILNDDGFASFYQQFMQSCWHKNNKTVTEYLLEQVEGYEFYRLWQDLSDYLIEEEHAHNLLPYGLIALLDNLQLDDQDDNERLQSYIDMEKDGVTILTTFVSKGLEFDNVFTLGLSKQSNENEDRLIPIIHNDTYHLGAARNTEDPLYIKHCEEIDAEKMRQLYVALTRAKSNLYVPHVTFEKQNKLSIGTASPMELLVAKMKCATNNYLDLYDCIKNEDGSTLTNFVNEHSDLMLITHIPSNNINTDRKLPKKHINLNPPHQFQISTSECVVQSYSSLVAAKTSPQSELESDLTPPHDFQHTEKNEHTIPSGNEIGILLHTIFEKITFSNAKQYTDYTKFAEAISSYTTSTRFNAWKDVIARIVFNTLITQLPGSHPPFCLADIHPDKIYRETEFLFPFDSKTPTLNDVKIRPGFIKGVIDMFFEHNGKYYLVDWKSNWLGSSLENYQEKNLLEAMSSNHYDIQASVYMNAMERYLKIIDPRPFNEIFGGTFYIFLRGVGANTGILHLPPTSTMRESC